MVQLPVRAIAFSPSGGHALSASEGERQVALWSLPAAAAAPSKKSRPSTGLLSLEEPAVQLATSAASSGTAPNEASSFQVSPRHLSRGITLTEFLDLHCSAKGWAHVILAICPGHMLKCSYL